MPERVHQLRTWPEEYSAIASGAKRFDLRLNDRDFQVGDKLILDEYDPRFRTVDPDTQVERLGAYTGEFAVRWVTHVQRGGRFGLAPDWAALSLSETPSGGGQA